MSSPAGSTAMPEVAFVLGGGGRWGAVEVGMLRALAEAGVEPDVIVGTSIGAINGAVAAATPGIDGIGELERMWAEVGDSDIFGANLLERARGLARLRVAMQDAEPLRDLIEHALSARTFGDLSVPFQCVAASIERATEHWFDRGDLVDALLASAAVPGLFPPVEIDGEHFYDGGLVDSVPVDRAIALGATEIYVLQVGRLEQPLRAPTRFYEPALLAFEIARRHRFGSVADRTPTGVRIHVLPSANEVDFDDRRQIRWSDMRDTERLIDGAYHASVDHLTGLADRT